MSQSHPAAVIRSDEYQSPGAMVISSRIWPVTRSNRSSVPALLSVAHRASAVSCRSPTARSASSTGVSRVAVTGFSRWITSPSALATHRWSWSLVMISMLNSSVVNAITTSPVVPSTASSSIRHLAYVCSERSIDSLENASETSTTGETHASSAVVVAARSAGSSEAKSATESSLGSNEPRSPALPTRRVHGDTPSELAEIALDVGASDSSVVDQPDERQQCGRTHHGPIGLEALTRRCRLGRGSPSSG